MDKKFYNNLTYEEWTAQQNKNDIEFRAIDAYHKTHPGYDLEEIKNSIYLNVIETETNQKICMESFSARHINSQKLNEQMSKLFRIIFSQGNEFKSIDKRGHGDTVSTRFGKGKEAEIITFKIEEKAVKHAHYLIEHNLVGLPTVSDIVRAGFVKYMEMLPIIREIEDAITNRFMIDIQVEREKLESLKVKEMLVTFDQRLALEEEEMLDSLRSPDSKDLLEETRDWVLNFIEEILSYNTPTKKEKAKIKKFIMENTRLYNILTTLERHGLISRDYVDNLRQKGIITPTLNAILDEDIKLNGEH